MGHSQFVGLLGFVEWFIVRIWTLLTIAQHNGRLRRKECTRPVSLFQETSEHERDLENLKRTYSHLPFFEELLLDVQLLRNTGSRRSVTSV